MPDSAEDRAPWVELQEIIEAGDADGLREFIDELAPSEVARAISRLDEDEQAGVVTLLSPVEAADLIEQLSDTQGADVIEELPAFKAAAIVDQMDSDHRVDLLQELDDEDAEAILREMDPEEAEDARRLLGYEEGVAGGIMMTEFISYPRALRIRDVLQDLRRNAEEYSDYEVQYVYVESETGVLVGVVRLRDLVLAPNEAAITSVMIPNPVYVTEHTSLDDLQEIFDRYDFVGAPVTDDNGRLVGIVRRADVEEAYSERSERNFMKFSGIIGGDELRSMSLMKRAFGRLSWLTVNMMLNMMSAWVIIFYQATVQRVVLLAVALPLICNMSGCSGNQAVAVSVREMALGLIKPRDLALVFIKEVQVGLINGVCLGTLLGILTYLYNGTFALGLVVGGALALNTIIAVVLGGAVPLLFKAVRIDPAIAAAPVMTTLIDTCGFFLVLSFAALGLHMGFIPSGI